MQLVDRFGDQFHCEKGSLNINLGSDTGQISYSKNGTVVTYTFDSTVKSTNGNKYEFNNFLPFSHPLSYGTIASFVGPNDLKIYGDIRIKDKDIWLYLPTYSAPVTLRGSVTVVINE